MLLANLIKLMEQFKAATLCLARNSPNGSLTTLLWDSCYKTVASCADEVQTGLKSIQCANKKIRPPVRVAFRSKLKTFARLSARKRSHCQRTERPSHIRRTKIRRCQDPRRDKKSPLRGLYAKTSIVRCKTNKIIVSIRNINILRAEIVSYAIYDEVPRKIGIDWKNADLPRLGHVLRRSVSTTGIS